MTDGIMDVTTEIEVLDYNSKKFKINPGKVCRLAKKYHTTLIEKELHPTEQEYLAAVMIYEKSQKDKKIDIEQESDEGR